jgi:uncharacterized glyoxalase superfamily protein PhnB
VSPIDRARDRAGWIMRYEPRPITPHDGADSGRHALPVGAATAPGRRRVSADPQVIPYLLYEDAATAMEWLATTFGFSIRARDQRPDGTIRHGELQLDGGGVIMLGSPGPGYHGPAALGGATQLIRITVGDLAGHRQQAVAAGAKASAIEPGPAGWISYSSADPEGHEWYFTQPVAPPPPLMS